MEDMSFAFSSNETADSWLSLINETSDSKLSKKPVEHPMFSMHEDFRTRVLIAIILGCDVHQGGCHNTGPSKIESIHK